MCCPLLSRLHSIGYTLFRLIPDKLQGMVPCTKGRKLQGPKVVSLTAKSVISCYYHVVNTKLTRKPTHNVPFTLYKQQNRTFLTYSSSTFKRINNMTEFQNIKFGFRMIFSSYHPKCYPVTNLKSKFLTS